MEDPGPSRVGTRAAAGASLLIVSRLGARVIDFLTLIVLARVLTPADFGLVAIALTLVMVVEAISELPVASVLVSVSELTKAHLDTAFTLSAIRAGVVALVLLAAAWPASLIYHDDRLVPLICVLSLAPSLRGMWSPGLSRFARSIDFRRDLVIEIAGKIAAFAASTAVALTTHSYWAIATGSVINVVVMIATSYALAPYRPHFSLREWRHFAGFLGWTSASQLVNALNWQSDRLLVGTYVPLAVMGQFSMANDLAVLPEQGFVKPVLRPLMAAYSLIRSDKLRLEEAYLKSSALVFTLGLPMMLGLSLLAEPAVRLALGGKWLSATPYLHWLALATIPAMVASPLNALAMVLGQARIFLRLSTAELVIKIPMLFAMLLTVGIMGVVALRIVLAILVMVISMFAVRELIGLSLLRQASAVGRAAMGGIAYAAFLSFVLPTQAPLEGLSLLLWFAVVGPVALVIYGTTIMILWIAAGRPPGVEQRVGEAARHVLETRILRRRAA
jgi:O-antigen/teichoic acid export membrane protein